jgi:hypothetical protein
MAEVIKKDVENEPIDKLKFYAYKGSDFKDEDKALTFEVQFNPSEWGYSINIEYNDERPQNATDSQKSFKRASPTGLSLSFMIDGTGVAGKEYADLDVKARVDEFCKVVVDYSSDKHRPRFVMLIWGKMVFKGVVQSVNVKYNLFTPDGNPLRAKIDVSLSSALSYERQVAENSPDSPDMTHIRSVMDGDNIPLMTYDIYQEAKEYVKIARYNNLTNFRRLYTGQKIAFPPLIEKKENK